MDFSIEAIAIFAGISVFMSVIAVFALLHSTNAKNIKEGHVWLFENWQVSLYNAIFGKKLPEDVGRSIGVDVEKYLHNCKLIKKKPRVKQVVINKIVGFFIIGVGCVIGLVTLKMFIALFAVIAAFPLIALPIHFVEEAAKKRKLLIAEELPRFLDMLHTALIIGMPIDQAIELTASNLKDTILAEELLTSLAETKMGTVSWQEALQELAENYNVDELSDFVLDITNAYRLGASIQESVARKSRDIKQSNLVAMKERASKLTNSILLPITIFKIAPILAIMVIPILLQLMESGF